MGTKNNPGAYSQAVLDVAAERRRQIEAEGYDPAHDDKHQYDELALAAASYALAAVQPGRVGRMSENLWPWGDGFKRKGRRQNMVRAAALLLAAIEQHDRLNASPETA